ncbi:transposase [Microbacterium sp. NPDC086615]|uniref:transposase n=1 Tax=Microbacterium sp. NPDC086615 TaxID=3154865 RepID=UPI0034247C5A
MTPRSRHLRAVTAPAAAGRRSYTDEFRQAAVARVSAGEPVAAVVRELGVARNTLKAWVRDSSTGASESEGSEVVNDASALLTTAATGSRRDVLVQLRDKTATKIDAGLSAREYPVHVRLLDEIIQSIAAIDAQDRADQETIGLEDEPLDPEDI